MLPPLCNLSLNEGPSVDVNLFEFLSRGDQRAGKTKGCSYHSSDPENDDEKNNCSINGYLMTKKVPALDPGTVDVKSMYGKDLYVYMPDGRRTVHALLNRYTSTDAQRLKQLTKRHKDYVDRWFDIRCIQKYVPKLDENGNPMFKKDGTPKLRSKGIEFDEFGEELARTTDWYFVDEWITKAELLQRTAGRRGSINPVDAKEAQELAEMPSERGHLFLRLYDTQEMKMIDKMPYEGVFDQPYLYIIVICASGNKGFGNYMMKMAENVAFQCGCTTLALAALPDAAGFYYGKHGFRFNRYDGGDIDLEGTPWHDVQQDGKVFLVPDIDYVDPLEEELRTAMREREQGDEQRMKRNREIEEEPREEGDLQPKTTEEEKTLVPKRSRIWHLLTSFFM